MVNGGDIADAMMEGGQFKTPRECEVCHHRWRCKYSYEWIVLCPKCRVSGYHMPQEECNVNPVPQR